MSRRSLSVLGVLAIAVSFGLTGLSGCGISSTGPQTVPADTNDRPGDDGGVGLQLDLSGEGALAFLIGDAEEARG